MIYAHTYAYNIYKLILLYNIFQASSCTLSSCHEINCSLILGTYCEKAEMIE